MTRGGRGGGGGTNRTNKMIQHAKVPIGVALK